MKVLVTGATGQLGTCMVKELGSSFEVIGLTHSQLDLTNYSLVMESLARLSPEIVVNCAAYNAVDAAEDQSQEALNVNAFGVQALARATIEIGACLVHYSTDFIFDGSTNTPYTEEDVPGPLGTYAASKLLGEWFAQDVPRHYVLRVESLFGGPAPVRKIDSLDTYPKSSVNRIVKSILAGREVNVFTDRTVSPSYVIDVVTATRRLIELDAPAGIYHCVNSGMTTWDVLALELARLLGHEANLVPMTMAEAKLRTKRPVFCALSNAKLEKVGVVMPTWQDALSRFVSVGTTYGFN